MMMPEYGLVVYLDVQLLMLSASFLIDYLLLRATAALTHTSASWRRLCGGAAIGTLYHLAYLCSLLRLIPAYGWLHLLPVAVVVSFLMLLTAFAPVPRRRFWSIVAHFYAIAFMAGGTGLAVARTFGQPNTLRPVAGIAAGAVCILLVAELGWGVLQRRSWRQSLKVPLEITFGTATASITALLDTGNQLKCPLSGVPVIVVEHRMLAEIFPPSLLVAIERLGEGDLSTLSSQISSTPWSSRFRIIPYTSIGASNGLMIGFRPTAVSLWLSGQVYVAPTCIIALSPQTLDPNGAYHALIGLDLVEGYATEQESSRSGSELGSTYTHGCPNLEVATRHQMGK
jgi:stage II sporulation protein GA (sporulation sigma-E factor processing peptidase)